MKRALIIIRTAPYGEASSAEGYRAAIALPAMGVETTALIMEDGVFCLVREADATRIGWRGNLADAFVHTNEFDAKLVVHEPSLRERGIRADEVIDYDEAVDDDAVKSLVDGSDVVLTF